LSAPIIVAGAGIGGLTAALALADSGRRALVLEQAPVIAEVGAGLQIAPNAGRVLARLGLEEALAATGLEPQAVNIRRGRDGDVLARLDLTVARARWGAPFRVFHRADLQQLLLRAARAHPLIEVREGARVADFRDCDPQIEIDVETTDGLHTISADGLVGADGGRSAVRAQLLPIEADAPVYSGASAWRALVPAERAPDFLRGVESHLWLLPGAHVVHYPLRDGGIVNVVIIIAESAPQPAAPERSGTGMAGLLAGYRAAPALCALIGGAETYRYWPLYARPPLKRWSHGAVTLLGDAAHPMAPFLAQGAAQAIEDADALGRAFATTPEAPVEAVFAVYERQRRTRAAAIVRASARQGRIDHLRGPLAAARDLAIRALGGDALLARNDWLYRGPAPG